MPVLHCLDDCPYAYFDPHWIGGVTERYYCKVDPKAGCLADGPDECRADLDLLRTHRHANTLFADTIRIRTDEEERKAKAQREHRERIDLNKELLRHIMSSPNVTPASIREALIEIEGEKS